MSSEPGQGQAAETGQEGGWQAGRRLARLEGGGHHLLGGRGALDRF